MAYYYVKNGGTASGDTGRFATKQTGSFATLGAASYYATLALAMAATTPPAADDFILLSDLHAESSAANLLYTGTSPNAFFVVAVDDANIDLPRTSGNLATITTTAAADFTINSMIFSGVHLQSDDNILLQRKSTFIDSKLTISTVSSFISNSGDGAAISLINSELAMDHATSTMLMGGGVEFCMFGGKVTTTSAGITDLFLGRFTSGGGTVCFIGADLSAVVGTLIAGAGADPVGDDIIAVNFTRCEIDAGVAFTDEVFKMPYHRLQSIACSATSSDAEYQYHLHAFGGDVDDDSAIFRNEDEAFTESNQKISYKIVTNSDASVGSPLWFHFPVLRYTELSVGATDTLRFYITSNTALTDKDIYIEIIYPDGTNKQTPNLLTSAPSTVGGSIDLLATGTTLTTDSTSTWTGGLTNKYQIDVDTSVDPGSDCQPVVKVCVSVPSVTIQIASEFGLN